MHVSSESVAQLKFPPRDTGEFEVGAREISHGGDHFQPRHRRGCRSFSQAGRPHEQPVCVVGPSPGFDAESRAGVSLRIQVEDQDVLADGGERGAKIDRCGRLAHATFLVGHGDCARWPLAHRTFV